MWMVFITVNFVDTEGDLAPQGPLTLEQAQGYIALTLQANPDATSFVVIMVPKN